jgi:hypothetical protein
VVELVEGTCAGGLDAAGVALGSAAPSPFQWGGPERLKYLARFDGGALGIGGG